MREDSVVRADRHPFLTNSQERSTHLSLNSAVMSISAEKRIYSLSILFRSHHGVTLASVISSGFYHRAIGNHIAVDVSLRYLVRARIAAEAV